MKDLYHSLVDYTEDFFGWKTDALSYLTRAFDNQFDVLTKTAKNIFDLSRILLVLIERYGTITIPKEEWDSVPKAGKALHFDFNSERLVLSIEEDIKDGTDTESTENI